MELMIVIAAAILAWVVGAIWYRLTHRVYSSASALQIQNIGGLKTGSVMPYLLAGVALVAVTAMIRVLFIRAGVDGIGQGMRWGAAIGAALVAPWFVIENTNARRPVVMTLIDMAYAILACTVIGAVMGGI